MQTRMATLYNLHCIYRLHNLNIQLALLEYERAIRQRRRQRRYNPYRWRLPRPWGSWFEIHFNNRAIPPHYFKTQLRMDRDTFDVLLNLLHPSLLRQNTSLRDCIPPEKVLALGLYRLAHGNSYSTIGANFGVGKSTVIEAVQDVTEAIFDLRNEYIKFPVTEAETIASIETFSDLSNLPNVAGAIDGTHIEIKAPLESAVDYFSRYHQYDFIVQGVVNGQKLFLDFSAGFPGSLHDARVLRNSTLYRRAERDEVLSSPTARVGHREIRPYLVGDSAYPLGPWLQKPFPEATRDRDEIAFNRELTAARVSVECAFGILKSRWRILGKRFESKINFAVKTAIACAVLHNFCIRNGDDWDERDEDDHDDGEDDDTNVMQDGDNIREVLKEYISSL